MPPGERDSEKRRQKVRRHFKPSLGRFVDQYRRTGENAEDPPRKQRHEGAKAHGDGDRAPRRHATAARRFGLPALVIVGIAAAIATIPALVGGRGDGPVCEIRAARAPVLVEVHAGGAVKLLESLLSERKARVETAVLRVLEALDRHPEGLVTITLPDVELCFDALPAPERSNLETAYRDADRLWETTLAGFLHDVLAEVAARREAPVSVAGLPVEPRSDDPAAARRANARYRVVIDAIDPLVSDHAYLRGATSLTEEQLVRSALPEAMRHRARRPVLFQTNGRWRVLLDAGALDADDDFQSSRLRQLVADAAPSWPEAAR